MRIDQLEKGFWGYKKASVYEYITKEEEEFAVKLTEKDNEYKQKEEEYKQRENEFREKIQSLEQEIIVLKEQLEHYKREQSTIAETLVEATKYGESLRTEAHEKMKKEREEWEKKLNSNQNALERYHNQIEEVREIIIKLLKNMDEQSEVVEQQIKRVKFATPRQNMSLFERKNDENHG